MPDTVIKSLPLPMTIGGVSFKEIEMRPATLDDLIEAEKDAHPQVAPFAFRRALACRQMVRAGTLTGPFAPSQLKMLQRNWEVFSKAMDEADALGEDEQPSQAQPG